MTHLTNRISDLAAGDRLAELSEKFAAEDAGTDPDTRDEQPDIAKPFGDDENPATLVRNIPR